MNIISIQLQNFRKFDDQTIDFKKGINVIFGSNELGKTTTLLGILTGLYADTNTKSAKFLELVQSWNSPLKPVIVIKYEYKDEGFTIIRDFQKNFQELKSGEKGILAQDAGTISSIIADHTGLASSEIYKLTALIEQDDVALVGSQLKKLQDGIQEALTGVGHVSINDVIKNLNQKISSLEKGLHRPAKINGKIKDLQEKVKDQKEKLKEVREYVSEYTRSTAQKQDSSSELSEVKKKISYLENLLDNNKIRQDAERRMDELSQLISEKEKKIKEVERFQEKIIIKEKELGSFGDGEDISTAKLEITKLNTLLEEREDELTGLDKELAQNMKEKESRQKASKLLAMISLLIVVGIAAILGSIGGVIVPALIAGSGIGGFLAIFFTQVYPKQITIDAGHKLAMREEIKEKILEVKQKKKSLFNKYSVSGERELFSIEATILAHKEDLVSSQISLQTLLGQNSLEGYKEEQSKLLAEKSDLETNVLIEEVKSSIIDPKDLFSKQRELDELMMLSRDLESNQMKALVVMETSKYSYDDMVLTEEVLRQTEEDLRLANAKYNTLKLVSQFITEARDEVVSSSGDIISRYIEEFLPLITGNRYKEVKIDSDLQVTIFSQEKNDWLIPDDALSRGTVDQIYFVVRLAILSIICKDISPPIILDDPFVTFDKRRRDGVLDILRRISKNNQVILLTCHDDYNSWGNLTCL